MKTNFLNKLKQGMFLLIAVLGTFVGFSQSTQNPTIGGKNTPGDLGGLLDIGGGKSSDGGLGLLGQFNHLTTTTQCTFAFDIGGRGTGTSTDTGQVNDTDPFDIGGNGGVIIGRPNILLGFTFNELGGGGKGTSSDTGQVDSPDDWDDMDTGGRGTNTGTGEFATIDIGGGKNSTGGMENTNPICPDTGGGNGGKNTTGVLVITDTGGRDTGGGYISQGSASDIGGRNDTGTGALTSAFYGEFNSSSSDVAYFDSSEIENDPIPGCIFDTGGKSGTGTSTGGDFYIVENTLSSECTENNGCVLRPFFRID